MSYKLYQSLSLTIINRSSSAACNFTEEVLRASCVNPADLKNTKTGCCEDDLQSTIFSTLSSPNLQFSAVERFVEGFKEGIISQISPSSLVSSELATSLS